MFVQLLLVIVLVFATSTAAFQLGSSARKMTSLRMSIKDVRAREVFDSRGNPTVEVDVITEHGCFRASVPSGASTGIYEACELRDSDNKARLNGKGVLKAVKNVNEIIGPQLKGWDEAEQSKIDHKMIEIDGTHNKANLGANAILGVSLAVAKAGAAKRGVPLYRHVADLAGNTDLVLPVPSFNVINGGVHAGNGLTFQEFMALPVGASSFAEAMDIGANLYAKLKACILERYGPDAINVGDEGGYAPPMKNNLEALEVLMEAIEKTKCGDKIVIGMDVAASELYADGTYDVQTKHHHGDHKARTAISGSQLGDIYLDFCKKYPIKSIEDPFEQDDFKSWTEFTARAGKEVQVVGDDLTVSNPKRIAEAIEKKSCNALLLKVNQIGSLTESIEAVKDSKRAGWGVMTSHRSGETEDTYIADIAVGLCSGQIKAGAPCRSERTAKYNQLLRIEEELKGKSRYAGVNFRTPGWMGK